MQTTMRVILPRFQSRQVESVDVRVHVQRAYHINVQLGTRRVHVKLQPKVDILRLYELYEEARVCLNSLTSCTCTSWGTTPC